MNLSLLHCQLTFSFLEQVTQSYTLFSLFTGDIWKQNLKANENLKVFKLVHSLYFSPNEEYSVDKFLQSVPYGNEPNLFADCLPQKMEVIKFTVNFFPPDLFGYSQTE